MPDTVLPLGAFGLIFVALVGLYRQLRTIQRALDTTQRDIADSHRELAKINIALQTIKQRTANTAKDNHVDEFVEIDSDQWLDDQDHRELRNLKPL
ncbi:hypothetical protein N9R09_03405 [Porticoccaceae bacterium]|nr:hypothetical protein [Porticoccaceae bacterium]